ncbi:MAG: ankyrin repeat domain-containing protein [Cytophagia bacterium]|nr:ankyrin repeat domain-containing protein [Cytophagia bacterium]
MFFQDNYKTGQVTLANGETDTFVKLNSRVHNAVSKKTGLSLFHYFIIHCQDLKVDTQKVFDAFLNSGTNINARSNGEHGHYSALHFAVQQKEGLPIVKLLLNHKIDISLKDKHGNTAFWNACHEYRGTENQKKVIQSLIEYGASLYDTNNAGISVIKLIKQTSLSIDEGINPKAWDLREIAEIANLINSNNNGNT